MIEVTWYGLLMYTLGVVAITTLAIFIIGWNEVNRGDKDERNT